MNIFDKNKLFELKKAILSLNDVSTSEGIVLIWDGNDKLEVGNEVFVQGEDGLEPAMDDTYTVGEKLVKVEGGIVIAIVEKDIEQPIEETIEEVKEEEKPVEEVVEEVVEPVEVVEPIEEPIEEVETVEEVVEPVEEVVEEPIEEPTVEELNQIIEEQKQVIEDLKQQIEELKSKLEEPLAKPIEEEFKKEQPIENKKIDFTKYIKKKIK